MGMSLCSADRGMLTLTPLRTFAVRLVRSTHWLVVVQWECPVLTELE